MSLVLGPRKEVNSSAYSTRSLYKIHWTLLQGLPKAGALQLVYIYMWQLMIEIESYAHFGENAFFAKLCRMTPNLYARQV